MGTLVAVTLNFNFSFETESEAGVRGEIGEVSEVFNFWIPMTLLMLLRIP